MANTSSAKKAVKTIARRTEQNKVVRTSIKTAIKKANVALKSNEGAQEALGNASKALDQAAAKGVIHKNKASRKKSRLAKRVNKATA